MIGERSRSGFGVCRSPIGRLDEEIVERARHVRAGEWLRDEQHATRLEQKLADLRSDAEEVETQSVLPASHPDSLRRTMSSRDHAVS